MNERVNQPSSNASEIGNKSNAILDDAWDKPFDKSVLAVTNNINGRSIQSIYGCWKNIWRLCYL